MARYTIWFDGDKAGGRYSIVDISTHEPVVGEDGKPLTNLSFKQAVELIEILTRDQKS